VRHHQLVDSRCAEKEGVFGCHWDCCPMTRPVRSLHDLRCGPVTTLLNALASRN